MYTYFSVNMTDVHVHNTCNHVAPELAAVVISVTVCIIMHVGLAALHVYMYVYMCVYMYVYMYVYKYMFEMCFCR